MSVIRMPMFLTQAQAAAGGFENIALRLSVVVSPTRISPTTNANECTTLMMDPTFPVQFPMLHQSKIPYSDGFLMVNLSLLEESMSGIAD
jgi:hypothetical protein